MVKIALPIGEEFSPEQLRSSFPERLLSPPANEGYGVRLRAPLDWVEDRIEGMDRPVELERLTPLVALREPEATQGTEGPPGIFLVQALRVPREISARDWLLHYLRRTGGGVRAAREISPFFVDALTATEIEGAPFAARLAVRMDADRAFLLSGVAHAARFDELAPAFGVMVASFAPLQPRTRPFAEEHYTLPLLETSRLSYPASWSPFELPGSNKRDKLGYELRSVGPEGSLGGLIRIEARTLPRGASGEAEPFRPEEEHAEVLEGFLGAGLQPSASYKEIPMDPGETGFTDMSLRRYEAYVDGSESEHELFIALIRGGGLSFRVSLLTTAREEAWLRWAFHKRAYDIVLGSLSL